MRRNGFTLIELIVVVCIIGILAVVIFPALRGGRSSNFFAPSNTTVIVPDHPDLSKCSFVGLDSNNRSVFKCSDQRITRSDVNSLRLFICVGLRT